MATIYGHSSTNSERTEYKKVQEKFGALQNVEIRQPVTTRMHPGAAHFFQWEMNPPWNRYSVSLSWVHSIFYLFAGEAIKVGEGWWIAFWESVLFMAINAEGENFRLLELLPGLALSSTSSAFRFSTGKTSTVFRLCSRCLSGPGTFLEAKIPAMLSRLVSTIFEVGVRGTLISSAK